MPGTRGWWGALVAATAPLALAGSLCTPIAEARHPVTRLAAHRAARPTHHHAAAHRAPRVTVATALAGLLRSGAITQSVHDEDLTVYTQAARTLRRLTGTRRTELGAVLSNLEAMARAGQLTPSRLPVAFLTLRSNWEWWRASRLVGAGERVSLPGSRLVWEHYSGQGIEIQWLATFGEANGYYFAHDIPALQQVLTEAIALATQRAGGIAWEYMFSFGGGTPPWTSALSQGTALQALARAWSETRDTRYLNAAQQALGIFRTAPPEGVLAPATGAGPSSGAGTPAETGAWYLQYSYAPKDLIINGFIQSLVGLYDYAKLTGEEPGQQLFQAGDALARAQVPRFDTGAWSKYDQSTESDLSYHDLLTEFLEHLCQRTREIPGDEVYCTTATHFREDLKTAPVVQLVSTTVHARERAGVQVKLSKISTVSMTVTLGGKTVWSNRATVEGGTPRLLWVTPSKPGVYGVALRARDLAGNEATASGSITVKGAPKHRVKPHRGSSLTVGGQARPGRRERGVVRAWISPPARKLPAL